MRQRSSIEVKLTTGILLAIVAAIGFGVARVFAGLGVEHIKPLHGSVISLIVGWLLALAVCLTLRFSALVSVTLAEIGWLAAVGMLSFALGRGFSFLGIKYIGVSRSITIYASYPIFSMALAVPLLREKVGPGLVTGALLIIGGLAVITFEREAAKVAISGKNRLLGIVFSLASAISYGANNVLIKWVVSSVDPLVSVTVSLFFGTLFITLSSSRNIGASIKNSPRSAVVFMASGVAMTIGSIASFNALKLAPAVVVAPLSATSPLFAVVGTYLFLRKMERVTAQVVVGCVMVVAGGILVAIG